MGEGGGGGRGVGIGGGVGGGRGGGGGGRGEGSVGGDGGWGGGWGRGWDRDEGGGGGKDENYDCTVNDKAIISYVCLYSGTNFPYGCHEHHSPDVHLLYSQFTFSAICILFCLSVS